MRNLVIILSYNFKINNEISIFEIAIDKWKIFGVKDILISRVTKQY